MKRRALFAVALASALAGCNHDQKAESASRALDLWCWPDGLGKQTLAEATQKFAGLTTRIVEGDYLSVLTPALESTDAPAITGIKGEDMPAMLPRADLFVDLNTLGADQVQGDYLDWKWRQGSTLDNRLIGFPIDIGPTAMFYRADLFEKAGLPGDPDEVAVAIPTWDAFLDAGEKLRAKNIKMIANAAELFSVCCQQQTKRFVDESNHYIGDSAEIRTAWDIAVDAIARGISAGVSNDDKRWAGLIDDGAVATDSGAAWHATDIMQAAPKGKGKWRVANGAADGANIGGSFLALPAGGGNHQSAFDVIKWILAPENQAKMFAEAALFPSAPAAYKMAELIAPIPFFGDQCPTDVFAASAAKKKRSFQAPADEGIQRVFSEQLQVLGAGDATAEAAWTSAVDKGRAAARNRGVLTE